MANIALADEDPAAGHRSRQRDDEEDLRHGGQSVIENGAANHFRWPAKAIWFMGDVDLVFLQRAHMVVQRAEQAFLPEEVGIKEPEDEGEQHSEPENCNGTLELTT